MNASRRALNQRNSKPLLQSSQGLAHRRAAHTETISSCTKSLGVGNSDEYLYTIESFGHCEVELISVSTVVK